MGKIIEGVWDCQYCGTNKIRGAIRTCPNCGRTRDKDIKFYIDSPKNYIDTETAKKINKNPDWLCSYCDSLNSDDSYECHECGASREDSEQNYFERRAQVEKRQAERTATIQAAVGENISQTNTSAPEQNNRNATTPAGVYQRQYRHGDNAHDINSPHKSNMSRQDTDQRKSKVPWGNIFKVGAGLLASILLVILLISLFTPKVMDVTVQDFEWKRSIVVEELTTVEESGWSLPSDGRLLHSQQEIKTYIEVIDHYETKTRTYTEQVLDHYETYVSDYRDLGNGYFEEITSERPVYRTETRTETYEEPVYRQDPVYATKYYYERDVWKTKYTSDSNGNDKEPYWNEPTLIGEQRKGSRTATYWISVVNNDGEIERFTFDKDVWDSLNKGDKISIKVSFGHATLDEKN